jgi:uncharacterized protein (TIGR03435 family)
MQFTARAKVRSPEVGRTRNKRLPDKAAILAVLIQLVLVPALPGQTAAVANTPTKQNHPESALPKFDVSTVKINPHGTSMRLQYTAYGFSALNVPLIQLVKEAFGAFEEGRVVGGPAWINSTCFDIEAKVDEADGRALRALNLEDRRLMLRRLLVDRFGLEAHFEDREFPAYELTLSKSGPKLEETAPKDLIEYEVKGINGVVLRSSPGNLAVQGFSLQSLATLLSSAVGRIVIDNTGLTAKYNFVLHWQPDRNSDPLSNDQRSEQQIEPSIFAALQEQLGLSLKPTKSRIPTLLIDRIKMPSAN